MSAWVFVVVGLVAWMVLAVMTAFVVGAMAAQRDRQRPEPAPPGRRSTLRLLISTSPEENRWPRTAPPNPPPY